MARDVGKGDARQIACFTDADVVNVAASVTARLGIACIRIDTSDETRSAGISVDVGVAAPDLGAFDFMHLRCFFLA